MFATSSNKFKTKSTEMDLSSENDTEIIHVTDTNLIKFTTSMITERDENVWDNIKSFFNPQNSMIILSIICLIFFFITLCLVFIIIHLLKKKRLYQNQPKPTINNLPNNYPKFDHHHNLNFPSSPMQMGLTSNQIASLGNVIPIQESSPITTTDNNKTQSFDNFETELKQTWHEKGITSSNTSNQLSSTNNDEIETVNEVLGMEERNGKVYYKVNFTGHPSDYTAWVCEEDLIPE